MEFPVSPLLDAPLGRGSLDDIAFEAMNAFFSVVSDRLEEYYPESHTYGDVDPLEAQARNQIAVAWIKSHALNNTTVAKFNDELEDN